LLEHHQTAPLDNPFGEELVNSITHGIGVLLSIAGLVMLIVLAVMRGNAWHVVSFTIFGSTLILLYLASTLYHSFWNLKVKNIFARMDHSAIFLLIAGTYTPFVLTNLRGPWGWTIFGIIWGLAIAGVVLRSIYLEKYRVSSVVLYIGMGWLMLIAIRPAMQSIPRLSLLFLLLGGIFYTVGVIFYSWKKLPYNHGIWHLFVMAGSIMHYFAVIYSLT